MPNEVAPAANQKPAVAVPERVASGRALRERVPRGSHAEWAPSPDRPDPIDLLEREDAGRIAQLVPIRYGRMRASPFAFYRGAALLMAEDLSRTPRSGVAVQACGDAHLANFGIFATPERHVVFDLNDFDQTLPGPWEWDVKRLAASVVLAARHRDASSRTARKAATAAVSAYQRQIRQFADMRFVDAWYSRLDVDEILASIPGAIRERTERGVDKARHRDHLRAQSRMTEIVDGERRFVDDPPKLRRLGPDELDAELARASFADYIKTLPDDRRVLLSRYRLVDAAMKVVGIGSVGTICLIALLQGRDDDDPLILQVKEASPSVLERYLAKSRYRNHGQRIVEGQRLMQAASDMFLGWIRERAEPGRHFYWRQLRDVKGAAELDTIRPRLLAPYARICATALARAHARSGDAAMIAGYLGRSDAFAHAVAAFAEAYADQTERDHARLVEAITSGRIPAADGA